MPTRALLIGINHYRIPGADLRGCVNDVINLKAALMQWYAVPEANITTMLDEQATTKAMQTAIRKLITSGKKGDSLVLHFSGHGSNVPDANGDEADGRDEILCPHDLDWSKPLTDDWLRQTFDRLKPGVSLTTIFDCCHSGTATRRLYAPDAKSVPRYLPCPLDLMATESGRRLRGSRSGLLRASSPAQRKRNDVVVAPLRETLISGCRDDQESADAWIKGSFNGALTWALVQAIRETKGKASYRALHASILKRLAAGKYDQVPQLEGRKERLDQPFLSAEGV